MKWSIQKDSLQVIQMIVKTTLSRLPNLALIELLENFDGGRAQTLHTFAPLLSSANHLPAVSSIYRS